MVFSTPQGVEGFNHLTRLEEVSSAGHQLVTASGRIFHGTTLTSTDDTSLEYGILELRQKTPERLRQYHDQQLDENQRSLLSTLDWSQFVSELDSVGVSILHAALQKIRYVSEPAVVTVGDTRPMQWFYFLAVKPAWVPQGTRWLVSDVEDKFFAEDAAGDFVAVPAHLVQALLKHGFLRASYEPLDPDNL